MYEYKIVKLLSISIVRLRGVFTCNVNKWITLEELLQTPEHCPGLAKKNFLLKVGKDFKTGKAGR